MLKGYENKMLQINKQTKGLSKGSKMPIRVDAKGTPLDPVWRKKLKDAETDGCVSFVNKPKTSKTKEKE